MQFIKTRDVKDPIRDVAQNAEIDFFIIINGSPSKLHETYIFKKEINNEN